jgi:hypothetical protein
VTREDREQRARRKREAKAARKREKDKASSRKAIRRDEKINKRLR